MNYQFFRYPDIGVEWKKVYPFKTELEFLHFGGPNDIKMNKKSNLGEKNFWSTINFEENKLPSMVHHENQFN